jgi:beta-lactamase regulating signal transducer with metallopeptidase domain
MTDLLIQLTLSNLLISATLAGVAYVVHRHGRYPVLAHLLWVFVLVKLVTPPLLRLPVIPVPGSGAVITGRPVADATGFATIEGATAGVAGAEAVAAVLSAHGVTALLIAWALGSMLVFVASLLRIARFDRLLRRSSTTASAEVRSVATDVARQMGLKSVPTIYMSSAGLSPLTWWTGRGVRVVIPAALSDQMGTTQLRWVLAHELAHVKRRDHFVRWLEWLACVSFWWNPVVWWARRNLRLDEEVSCDALVLDRLGAEPRSYAKALLNVVEFLAGQTTHPPAAASAIDAGGSLERRFIAIISDGRMTKAPRWLVAGLMSTALLLMTLGLAYASDGETARDGPQQTTANEGVIDDQAGFTPAVSDESGTGAIDAEIEADQFVMLSANLSAAAAAGKISGNKDRPRRKRSWDKVFIGTSGADTYSGSGGRDKVVGNGGPDDLSGGGKRDLIRGGGGADTIAGGAGPDKLVGGPGDDTINGDRGRDVIRGGKGSDTIDAGAGNDIVRTWQDGTADFVDCGDGNKDRAVVGSNDSVVNCELVIVRDPAQDGPAAAAKSGL